MTEGGILDIEILFKTLKYMIGFILTLVIGIGIAFFSNASTSGVTLTIGEYKYFNIPLFVVTVGTYLLGIVLAWLIEVPQTIVTAFHVMGLGRTIRSGNNTITQLQNKINKLEMENSKLHDRNQAIIAERKADKNYSSHIIDNFLHRLKLR